MVRAPVDAVDDGVGRALQLVVQAALDQASQDRLCGLVAVEREAGDVGLASCPAHRPVHRLDDVAADAEIAQGRLEAGLQGPLRGTNLFRQAKPFKLGGATDHQTAKLGIFAGAAGAEVGDAAALVGDVAERSVETGPTLRLDLLLQSSADFLLTARSQFQSDPIRGAGCENRWLM